MASESRDGGALESFARRPLTWVLVFMLSGAVGPATTARLLPGVYRPDPITRTDVLQLLCLQEIAIRRDMPPRQTRKHIEALHEAMRRIDPSYVRPTFPLSDDDVESKSCDIWLAAKG